MLVVVVVAMLIGGAIGGYRIRQRRRYFDLLVQVHESRADFCTSFRDHHVDPSFMDRVADHERAIARKYRHGARYPWLSVEPDPPWPK